jgi:TolB-like protein/DNA-binding winged helix-turn-helix (wHTH) protein/cytochrome c-type biogenesis protein CcmH/NrfG
MGIITGKTVPKDRRTNGEISSKSAMAGSTMPSSGARLASDVGGGRFRFGQYVLDLQRGCLLAGNEEVALRPKSFELLGYFVGNPGRLVSKDELLTAVWPNVIVTEDSLAQCVGELRRAMHDQDQRVIRTVPRRGYRFEATVSEETLTDSAQVADVLLRSVEGSQPRGSHDRPAQAASRQRTAILVAICAAGALAASIVTTWWGFSPHERPAPPLSIAVLPFANLSGDPDQDYFAEGISSDLTTELSRLPGTLVIAHATARMFKGKQIDARQVGHELNVRYLLDGSVRRTGDEVRINAELIDAETGASAWAERYARKREQLPAWQDEVIGRIATTLNFRLTALESKRALRGRREDPEAYELTTRGWALVYSAKKPHTYAAARALFKQALERDPHAVNALAGIGWTAAVSVLDRWSTTPTEDLVAAEAAVADVLALDSNHVVGNHVRGFLLRLQRRTQSAHDAFRTVVALNPNFASGYAQLGVTALELGRPEETVAAVERAVRLSPRDPNLGPWLATAGMAELHLGHDEQAVSWLTRAIDTGTPVALHQAYLASALALAGRIEQAQSVLADFRKTQPSATIARLRAEAYSTEPAFVAQRERLYEGLRMAGLAE